jgi:hypothetical protein
MGAQANLPKLKTVEVTEPHGQILSYGYLSGSTDVAMRGTSRMPDARLKLKIGSRPGFVELDINRGQIVGLKPATQFGRDFLTYVLWAVSVDGKAANLGEITFLDDRPVSINVTTPYQTFWLMLTAEPHYAVVDPSPIVVLYSASETPDNVADRTAEVIKGKLVFHTHYGDYNKRPSASESVPNALLQARKAVELASRAGVLADGDQTTGKGEGEEELRAREALSKARGFLARAEAAYKDNPGGMDVAQFSRTAAQISENARALALGAVGGAQVSRLEVEVKQLKAELERLRSELSKVQPGFQPDVPQLVQVRESPALEQATRPEQPAETSKSAISKVMSHPITWVGLMGWIVAVMLLFRRRTI